MKKIIIVLPLIFFSFYLDANGPYPNEGMDNEATCVDLNAKAVPTQQFLEYSARTLCSVQITRIRDFGLSGEVAFVGELSPLSGVSVTRSTLIADFENGSSSVYEGYLNAQGQPVVRVAVSCSNRITNVVLTVFTSNCGNDFFEQGYGSGICAGGGFN